MPNNKLTRKKFLAGGLALAAGAWLGSRYIPVMVNKQVTVTGIITGANSKAGHLLRGNFSFPEPENTVETGIVITGGGISGLSAARELTRNNRTDFILLELGNETGGNSVSGKNEVSAYPWGAHYLPIPDVRLTELLALLEECGSITGYDKAGLPVYNEFHLCAAPEDRLFIHGMWQDGLIPHIGITAEDERQIKSFLQLVAQYRQATDANGNDIFALPVNKSSKGAEWATLDVIPFERYLAEKGYTSQYLLWYLNYCCRDDYGSTLQTTSAWAGLHYFASRKGKAANAGYDDVLTWPEGNGYLAGHIKKSLPAANIFTNSVVYSVAINNSKAEVLYYNTATNKSTRIIADKAIVATPQYVNKKILKQARDINYDAFNYTPWVVANITVNNVPDSRGYGLSWDNVFYGSESLGYVNACQQSLNAFDKRKVFTFYLPLTGKDARTARMEAYNRSHAEWAEIITDEMKKAHINFMSHLQRIDVWIWGHAMIQPAPCFISSSNRIKAQKNIDNCIYFAHSDLSGISVFEESFYQGINAAREILAQQPKTV